MSFKKACSEFKKEMRAIKVFSDVIEFAIKSKIDEMTYEEYHEPMSDEMAMWFKLLESQGGLKRMKLSKYALKKLREARANERKIRRI